MSQPLLGHIYGSLISLERALTQLGDATKENKKELTKDVGEVQGAVQHMRRIANKLQLQIAKSDWPSAVHSLEIFYGLNSMVKPEVLRMFQVVTKKESGVAELRDAVRANLH